MISWEDGVNMCGRKGLGQEVRERVCGRDEGTGSRFDALGAGGGGLMFPV